MKVRLPLVLVGLAIGFALQTLAQQTDTPAAGLVVSKEPFGKMPDGRPVEKFTLSNVHGMEVNIITYGGAIQSIKVPDKNGRMGDVVLGFDNLPDYLKHEKNYFSALIGRYCNRIANGQFVLDGTTYQIPPTGFRTLFTAARKALISRFGQLRRSGMHNGSEWSLLTSQPTVRWVFRVT